MITSFDEFTVMITGNGEINIPRGMFVYAELNALVDMRFEDICEQLMLYSYLDTLTKKDMYSAYILLRRLDAIGMPDLVPEYPKLRVMLEMENICGN